MSLPSRYLLILALVVLAGGCNREPEGFSERHLLDYGLDLTLLLPDSARVHVKDYGPIRDFTISDGRAFSLQIFEFQSPTGDSAGEKLRQLNTARQDPLFREVVREDDHGFIYAMQADSASVDYDFRYVRMIGDRELIFQTGLVGRYALADVERMYAVAANSRTGPAGQ